MENASPPLPHNFYQADAWCESLLNHFCDHHLLLPREILQKPLTLLTSSVENVISIYGNFPDTDYKLFRQTMNPFYEPGEYHATVTNMMKQAAIEEKQPNLDKLAESLLNIRRLYERDEDYICDHFWPEIEKIDAQLIDDKILEFGDALHIITKLHVTQINRMIKLSH